MNLLKLIICYITERQHRKCFDKWYCQDVRITLLGKIDIMLLNILSSIYPDYRPFLKKWHTGNKYERYTS
jgi:hypothetical protein